MPAYNEEAYIAKTIVGARRHADAVLVVDDGSTDETVAIAEALGAIVVRHATNRGYGGALQTIFSTARGMGVEELVIIDADGQHDPGDIPRLLSELRSGKDVVIGSRFLEGSAGDIPAYRKVGMKVLDAATTLAGNGLAITDSQSGFRAYGRRAIEAIRPSGEGMSAGSEILIQAGDHHLQVAEVPIHVRYDIEGTSSENPVSHGVGVNRGLLETSAADGYAMNVGGGHRITVNDLIAYLREITGSVSEVVYSDKQRGDAEHTLADTSLARELVDYRPEVSIQDGLGRFVAWYRSV
jgi:glycosyltransferase involved in cell wall biosynthesis